MKTSLFDVSRFSKIYTNANSSLAFNVNRAYKEWYNLSDEKKEAFFEVHRKTIPVREHKEKMEFLLSMQNPVFKKCAENKKAISLAGDLKSAIEQENVDDMIYHLCPEDLDHLPNFECVHIETHDLWQQLVDQANDLIFRRN